MSTEISMRIQSAVPASGTGLRAFSPPGAESASPAAPPAEAAASAEPPMGIEQAVQEMAQRAASANTTLDFRVEEDSGRVVVSIVDASDGTVLRQMPSEEALRIARSLAKLEPHLIDRQA